MDEADKRNLKLRILSAAILIPAVLFIIYHGGILFYLFLTALFFVAAREWYNISMQTPEKIWFLVLGVLYLLISFYALIQVRKHFEEACLFLLMVWASDTGGYIFGKFIGGRKLAPKISPNKTWAGLAGAALGPYLVMILWALLFGASVLWTDHLFTFGIILTLLFAVACQAGDLLVSYAKRRAKLKDTGDLIPGHGGVLDRIDALLMGGIFIAVIEYVS